MATLAVSPPTLFPAKPASRSASLEGVRALAALWVVCSHLWISQMGMTPRPGRVGAAANWLLYSHLAVDVFIVLSGYCLSLAVVRDGGLRDGARGFWRRRARRILPPLYLALALAAGVTFLLQTLDGVTLRIGPAVIGVNLFLLQDLFLPQNGLDGPLWSVAVEWRLSLLFPALVWLGRRGGPFVLLGVAAVVGYGLAAVVLHQAPQMLMSCPWYGFLFALGMCAASETFLGLTARARRGLGAGAVLALAGLLEAFPVAGNGGGVAFGRHMPLTDAMVGVLAALLLFQLRQASHGERRTWEKALLTWPPLVALGRFSYSLYLTHAPLLRLLERALRFVPLWGAASAGARLAVLGGLGLPLLVGGAYLFYLMCERPFMSSSVIGWRLVWRKQL